MKVLLDSRVRHRQYQDYRNQAREFRDAGALDRATPEDRVMFEEGAQAVESALFRRKATHLVQNVCNVGFVGGGLGMLAGQLYKPILRTSSAVLGISLMVGLAAACYEHQMEAFPINEAVKVHPQIYDRMVFLEGQEKAFRDTMAGLDREVESLQIPLVDERELKLEEDRVVIGDQTIFRD